MENVSPTSAWLIILREKSRRNISIENKAKLQLRPLPYNVTNVTNTKCKLISKFEKKCILYPNLSWCYYKKNNNKITEKYILKYIFM